VAEPDNQNMAYIPNALLVSFLAVLVRWCVSLNSYSGTIIWIRHSLQGKSSTELMFVMLHVNPT